MSLLLVVCIALVCGFIIHRVSLIVPRKLERQWLDESLDYLELESRRREYEETLITQEGVPGFFDYWPFSSSAAPEDGKYAQILIIFLTLGIVTVFFFQFRQSMAFYVLLPFIVLTVSASIIDLRHKLLPDMLVFPLLWLGLLVNSVSIFATAVQAIWAVVVIYAVIAVTTMLLSRLRGQMMLGAGDVKYMAALAAWVGINGIFVLLILAGIVFLGQTLIQKLFGENELFYAFGPSLTLAAMIVLWFGSGELQRLFEQMISFL